MCVQHSIVLWFLALLLVVPKFFVPFKVFDQPGEKWSRVRVLPGAKNSNKSDCQKNNWKLERIGLDIWRHSSSASSQERQIFILYGPNHFHLWWQIFLKKSFVYVLTEICLQWNKLLGPKCLYNDKQPATRWTGFFKDFFSGKKHIPLLI